MPVCLIVLAIILSVMQNRAKAAGTVDFVSRVAKWPVAIVETPVRVTLDWTGDFVTGIWSAARLRRENLTLRAQAARIYSLELELQELKRENARLSELSKVPPQKGFKPVGARVVGLDFQDQRILLNIGKRDGVRAGDPVIVPEGLVGQVAEVTHASAYVNLLTNSSSSVGVRVSGGSNEAIGVVKGNGSPTLLLEVFVEDAQVKANDVLLTSGVSQVYPPSLRIGFVTNVWLDRDFGIKKAIVHPFYNAAALREVVVLTR